jgi:hypothetical protein
MGKDLNILNGRAWSAELYYGGEHGEKKFDN